MYQRDRTRYWHSTLLTTNSFTSTLTQKFRYVVSFSSNIRRSHQRCSYQKGVSKNLTKFTGKPLCQSLFFNKVALAQVFSFEFCKTFKNTTFTEHLRTTASEIWKAPIIPNLQMAASVFISDKLDSCTNVPLRYVNDDDVNKAYEKNMNFKYLVWYYLAGSFHVKCLNFLLMVSLKNKNCSSEIISTWGLRPLAWKINHFNLCHYETAFTEPYTVKTWHGDSFKVINST